MNVLECDRIQASDGLLPKGKNPQATAYLSHFREWDAKKCEAMTLSGDAHPLIRMRALIFRGRYAEAEDLISRLGTLGLSPREVAEGLLEKARIAVFDGDWERCLGLISSIQQTELEALSRMTLLQVEATACFESGRFSRADRCLELVESLAEVFPNCTAASYAKLLQIKIEARRTGSPSALARLDAFWKDLVAREKLDLNMAQAILRAEIDVRRLSGTAHFRQAAASLLIAETMGETLYIALALIDCLYSLERPNAYEALLERHVTEWARVKNLMDEISGKSETVSSTGSAILQFLHCAGRKSFGSPEPLAPGIQWIVTPRLESLIDLKSGACQSLSSHPQLLKAIAVFGTAQGISKEDFFRMVWGRQKYAPHLHENLIFGVQQRLRTRFGIKLTCRDGRLFMPGMYVVS